VVLPKGPLNRTWVRRASAGLSGSTIVRLTTIANTPRAVLRLVTGYWISQGILVIVRLAIAPSGEVGFAARRGDRNADALPRAAGALRRVQIHAGDENGS
jgi:hypothetical protein